jgi:hypothetical protein
VKHGLHARHGLADPSGIANVRRDYLEHIGHGPEAAQRTTRAVVQDSHRMSGRMQSPAQRRTDETHTAGDQKATHVRMSSTGVAARHRRVF